MHEKPICIPILFIRPEVPLERLISRNDGESIIIPDGFNSFATDVFASPYRPQGPAGSCVLDQPLLTWSLMDGIPDKGVLAKFSRDINAAYACFDVEDPVSMPRDDPHWCPSTSRHVVSVLNVGPPRGIQVRHACTVRANTNIFDQ